MTKNTNEHTKISDEDANLLKDIMVAIIKARKRNKG